MSDTTATKPEDSAETPAPDETPANADAPDEDAVTSEGDAEPEAPKGLVGKLKARLKAKAKLVIIGAGVLAVLGTGAGLYVSGAFHSAKPHEVHVLLPDPPVDHQIARITVDLKPSATHPRPFIRLTLSAELEGETARAAFIANETKIMDAIQSHLRDTTFEQLQGERGTEALRTDITAMINRIIAPEVAITVLYKDILIR